MTQWRLETMEIARYPPSEGASVRPRGGEVQLDARLDECVTK